MAVSGGLDPFAASFFPFQRRQDERQRLSGGTVGGRAEQAAGSA
ncbi:hypothetical protein ACFFNY_01770 [Paenibacillus hodogayensis]|uniref:Uncharacterized protein n=1 Tax=Paenibacillus hodogayensis TaxID=279208 RepID=A0ABV5VPT8_9BACL